MTSPGMTESLLLNGLMDLQMIFWGPEIVEYTPEQKLLRDNLGWIYSTKAANELKIYSN